MQLGGTSKESRAWKKPCLGLQVHKTPYSLYWEISKILGGWLFFSLFFFFANTARFKLNLPRFSSIQAEFARIQLHSTWICANLAQFDLSLGISAQIKLNLGTIRLTQAEYLGHLKNTHYFERFRISQNNEYGVLSRIISTSSKT